MAGYRPTPMAHILLMQISSSCKIFTETQLVGILEREEASWRFKMVLVLKGHEDLGEESWGGIWLSTKSLRLGEMRNNDQAGRCVSNSVAPYKYKNAQIYLLADAELKLLNWKWDVLVKVFLIMYRYKTTESSMSSERSELVDTHQHRLSCTVL